MVGLKILKFVLYIVVRSLHNLIQNLVWMFNGTNATLQEQNKLGRHASSVQLLKIVHRGCLDDLLGPWGPSNFIAHHEDFVEAKYILKDNVTLYTISKDDVIFVEVDEGFDVYDSKNGSFLCPTQYANAKRIVRVPMEVLHEIADKLGDPKGTITFLPNTARCGSTLLTQIFESTERCVSVSEPDCFKTFDNLHQNIPESALDEIVKSCVRIICKPRKDQQVDIYLLKAFAPMLHGVPYFVRNFPQSKQLFMYREGLKVAQSFSKLGEGRVLPVIMKFLMGLHPQICKRAIMSMGLPSEMAMDSNMFNKDNLLLAGTIVWAVSIKQYHQWRNAGISISAVKYEDLVKRKAECTRIIFEYVGLPVELVDKALLAFEKDSQANSLLSMKNLKDNKVKEFTDDDKIVTDPICKGFGLPCLPEPCNLDGTITKLSDVYCIDSRK